MRLYARVFPIIFALAPPAAAGARLRHRAPAPDAVPQTPQDGVTTPEVLFTFDDGPHLTNTPRVMDELDKRGIKAVFFVNGWHFDRDERARALVKQTIERGHYIGNHTYSHRILCQHIKDAPREIDRNEDLIEEVIGFRPVLLRTPYGQHCRRLREIIAERGYTQIGWDIDAQEWRPGRPADEVARFIIGHLAHLKGRAIVLLHDTRSATVHALPKILDWLAQHPEIKVTDWHKLVASSAIARPTQPTASALAEPLEWLRTIVLGALARAPRWLRPTLAASSRLVL